MQKIPYQNHLLHNLAFFRQTELQEQDLSKQPAQILQIQSCIATRIEERKRRLLSTCSLIRAINIQSMPNQTTDEFIRALKRLLQEDDFLEQYIQFLHGPRRSTNQKFFINLSAQEVSSGNSILVEYFGGVDSLNKWPVQ